MSPTAVYTNLKDAIIRRFKPHRAEAILRIRFNILGLVALFVLAAISPLPSLPKAIAVTIAQRYTERWTNDSAYRWICLAEVGLAAVFSFNIVESLYAIKYPPSAPPTPARPRNALNLKSPANLSKSTSAKPFSVLSPQSSPQPQKPFAFSPSSSLSSLSGSTSGYPPSPISTPTRITQYSSIMTPRSSLASSTSTVGYTPSPAVRKQFGSSVGRALDGSYLGRIVKTEESDGEDM